jgi:membrane-associated phospholipid phosphatase
LRGHFFSAIKGRAVRPAGGVESSYCQAGSRRKSAATRASAPSSTTTSWTTGASAGTWSCAGWPDGTTYCGGAAYAARGNNAAGPYVVACSWPAREPMCMTTFPAGSLVRTWAVPLNNGNGLIYGDSSNPGVYGAAIWAAWFTGASLDAFEFDVGARGGPAVAPASLGRIESLYR